MSAYTFSLDRRGLAAVVAGLSAVGVLLFFSGMLVGVGARLPGEVPARRALPGTMASAREAASESDEAAGDASARMAADGGGEEGGSGGPEGEEPLYAVQVGEFAREEPALALLERLGARGYEAYLVSGYDAAWRLRMQVRFGAYDSEDGARLAADEVAAREGLPASVVPAEELVP
ncbi:MAG TPA: SPOR domain-containing protein [Longimicrobiaceae bacterium]|nr:SPOR domain-containing protein [Longimicrobiaceae bacterium]